MLRPAESQGSSMPLEILGAGPDNFLENCRDLNSSAWILAVLYFAPAEISTKSFLLKNIIFESFCKQLCNRRQ